MEQTIPTSSRSNNNQSSDGSNARLGRISTAQGVESTQSEFYFWADQQAVLESGQIVYARQPLPPGNNLGIDGITVYGVVERVSRLSGSRSIEADMRERDGDSGKQRIWPRGSGNGNTGTTYAHCRVIAIHPNVLTPLLEDTEVFLAGEVEAGEGYGYPEMKKEAADLKVGLLLNGGVSTAGAACLDTRYILGEFGGHINVTGKAGTGTKTSFLLNVIKHLILYAEDEIAYTDHLYLVPIIFNAKGSDLMWIGCANDNFDSNSDEWADYKSVWGESYWKRYATPFTEAQLYSYQVDDAIRTGLPENTQLYSWSLQDVIEWRIWPYLFSGDDRSQDLLMGVMDDIFQFVNNPEQTEFNDFDGLLEWVSDAATNEEHYLRQRSHALSTIKAAVRRIRNALNSNPLLVREGTSGQPPQFAKPGSFGPIIIDIDGLTTAAQRFAVASIIEYLKEIRRQHSDKRQVYILMLDELNRYAGRNSRDEVAKLFEHVAAQLRSQGIILLGAQQKASEVLELVFENCATKVLGNTGSSEIGKSIWTRELSSELRSRAVQLLKEEKLVVQDGFRYPMALKFPLSPWATKKREAKRIEDDAPILQGEVEL